MSSCATSSCPPSQSNTLPAARSRGSVRPVADVFENADHYQLVLEMPGVSAEQVDLSIEGRQLSVQAERTTKDRGDMRQIHREHSAVHYARSFLMSADVDSSNVQAACNNGLVTILLPKREESRPRRIPVQEA